MWLANLGDGSDSVKTFRFSIERLVHATGHGQMYYASEEFVDVILAFDSWGSFNMVFPRAHHYLFSMYQYVSSENF